MTEWGRIADDGTVFVRTPDGERAIGSWQAGSVEEGLAFYQRRYDDLAAEVAVLEGRIGAPTADPRAVAAAAAKLRESLPNAAAIGDLGALDERLQAVERRAAERQEQRAQERAAAAAAAVERKRALVREAEELADTEEWRRGFERFKAIVEEWKTIRGVDRRTDTALWEELSAARRRFDTRRRAHFAELDRQRDEAAATKERLIAEAESMSGSQEWAQTAQRYRDLMQQWKAAGRARREVDDALWQRFKAAQDAFFARRAESLASRDAEYAANVAAKEALVAEAESLDPVSDLEGARRRLRSIHERWERTGRVPRAVLGDLERRLGAVEQRVRDAGAAARPGTVSESPLVIRLRESVAKLESRLERARAAGDDKLAAETEQALETQRAWLAQAEQTPRR